MSLLLFVLLSEHMNDVHDNYRNVREICVRINSIDNADDKSGYQQLQRYKNVNILHLNRNCLSLAHVIYLDYLITWSNVKKIMFDASIPSNVLLESMKRVMNTIKSMQLDVQNLIELFDNKEIKLDMVENIIITRNDDVSHPITFKFIQQLRDLLPKLKHLRIHRIQSNDEALLIISSFHQQLTYIQLKSWFELFTKDFLVNLEENNLPCHTHNNGMVLSVWCG
ncbi:unnamed protein product [Didymodactylos carnosus]|uniref:Uncharacterized protein n=2 Tax=Didymodactylos carnosus TaxID=1234261 RepID=A0A8S2D8R4_9BILA|nr:unnamed protein product [Didymodactylos carnosus]CAF3618895.1 unnamed protein product [Didymodactylos carnosus]